MVGAKSKSVVAKKEVGSGVIVGRVFALDTADTGSIFGILYVLIYYQ